MTEIGNVFVEKAVESLVDSTSIQLGYIWNYQRNFENLEKQLQKLRGKNDIVQHSVDEAKRNGKEIEQQVVNWLDDVNKMIDEVTQIIDDNKKVEMKCFKNLCPNLKKRYQHSKNAINKAKDVSLLYNEGTFDRISYHNIPKETWHPSSKLYEDFESRISTLTEVINALSSPHVNVVGVHGMGGIGKTTLAREVGKKAKENKLFDSIVFVEVSEKPYVMTIQEVIADMLSLTFREKTQSGRARALCERLQKERKVLLILDNIWESLDLEKVGIPMNDDHRGCKLLLTARNTNVLLEMDCQVNFHIGFLKDEEAWNLFEKIAGSCVRHHELQSLAFDVATRCGGLPIAIVTIAKALKNKQLFEWENALLELQRPSSESQDESVTQKAYSCILLSYNHLKSDELKSTFLLCCTLVLISHASLEELLRYGLCLNLFKRIKTMEEARHRVNTLIQKLKDSSLLLETSNDEHFSIHDVVRDVGRVIALNNHKNFIVDDIRDLLATNTLENCTSISLLNIAELPKELDCPHLTFFYMKTKTKFSIPDNFFNGMPKLEVLHLKKMDLSELPASLPSLKKLRTLYLDRCNLGDIAIVGDIKNLEILVLFNSQFVKKLLSKEIGKLNRLRLLDLRKSSFIIPPKTISRLTQLEELYLDNWYDRWLFDIETSIAILDELKDLCHLTALHIYVANPQVLPKSTVFKKLKRYEIVIGHNWERGIRETSRTLWISSDTNLCSEDGVIKQLKGIEDLKLEGKQRITNILYELDGEGFPKLKHFRIKNNPFIMCIVDSMLSATCDAFPLLQTLSLNNLVRLEKICHDQLRTKCFCQLRIIKVRQCHKLKNLFSFSIAKHLSVLEEIEVFDCRNIEEIFIVDRAGNGVNNPVFLEQLHFLTLNYLPSLRRIHSETEVASTFQERQMPLTTNTSSSEIILKDRLAALPLLGEKVVFSKLNYVKLHDINWKYVFSSSTLGSFNHLQHLRIHECKDLEELIRIDDKCSNYVEFPSLQKLEISNCPELREFVFSEKVSYPSLQVIEIEDMANLRRIWQSQVIQSVHYCPKLCKVGLRRCQSLENVFPASIARNLLELEKLSLWWCGIKEIVAKEEEVEEATARFSFPQLTSLRLCYLEELGCFYPGKHTTKWPKLEDFLVDDCEKLDLFSFQKHNMEEQLDDDPTVQQLFVDQILSKKKLGFKTIITMLQKIPEHHKVFSKLEQLSLRREEIGMLLQRQLPQLLFPRLKLLEVFEDESIVFPLAILKSFHGVYELKLNCSSYEEIFSYEDFEKFAEAFTQIKSLSLYGLDNLKQMWKQDSSLDLILQKLKVEWCGSLVTLMPPSSSFRNLTNLSVEGCDGLMNLLAPSTAKGLVLLGELKIIKCKTMTEVISSNEEAITDDEIVFSELWSLKLDDLSSLSSFCPGNYTITFPRLLFLTLKKCPKIKSFSSGVLNTPCFKEIRHDDGTDCFCDYDLNAAIQEIHEKLNAKTSPKYCAGPSTPSSSVN